MNVAANPTRVRPLSALAATEVCVHDLVVVADISGSAASHQLRLLKRTMYHLTDAHVTLLTASALAHAWK